MFQTFINETVPRIVESGSWLAIMIVLAGGIITSISPCILSIIPVMVGYIGGYTHTNKSRGFWMSLMFLLGLSTTFSIFGIAASALGLIFGQLGAKWYYVVAAISIIMGLNILGVFQINFPVLKKMPIKGDSLLSSFLMGMFFGLVASPCATPVLAVILTYAAAKRELFYGAILLFFYGIGHGLPILIAGTFTALIKDISRFQRLGQILNVLSGIALIGFGLYFLILARW